MKHFGKFAKATDAYRLLFVCYYFPFIMIIPLIIIFRNDRNFWPKGSSPFSEDVETIALLMLLFYAALHCLVQFVLKCPKCKCHWVKEMNKRYRLAYIRRAVGAESCPICGYSP